MITIASFGFLHEVPQANTRTLLIDLRDRLRDPHVSPTMRQKTGHDPEVQASVRCAPEAEEILEQALKDVMDLYDPLNPLQVLLGCQGGRHRSVVIATDLATALRDHGYPTHLVHHHVQLPVATRSDQPQLATTAEAKKSG